MATAVTSAAAPSTVLAVPQAPAPRAEVQPGPLAPVRPRRPLDGE